MLIDLTTEQVEYLRALLFSESNGAAEFVSPDVGYRHIDGDVNHAHDLIDMLTARVMGTAAPPKIYAAEVETFDGLYLFEREEDRDAFVEARTATWPEAIKHGYIATGDSPLNDAAGAKLLIDAEKRERVAEELIDKGWPSVAEDVSEGLPTAEILSRLRDIGEGYSEAAEIVAGLGE